MLVETFIKSVGLSPESIQDTTTVAYPSKPVLVETFYFNDRFAELKKRRLIEWRKLDHSIVVAAISQWRRRLSACVRAQGG